MMRLLFCLLLAVQLHAAWKAGAAKVSITPGESIWMAGFASRTKPSEGVRQEIWSKALALEDAAGTRSLLVTLDLVSIRPHIADAVAAHVKEKHGIPRERLLLNVSHTHSAPIVGDFTSYESRMGEYLEKQRPVIARYTAALPGKINESIDKAIAALAPATLHYEQGFAGFAVNRRRVTNRTWPGPVDHDVPVLAIGSNGRIRAIVFGYACHNTVLSDNRINGDYAGYAQDALERQYPESIALFVQGAGADANALPRNTVEAAERYGATLAHAVDLVLKGKMRPVSNGLTAVMEKPEIRFRPLASREELQKRLATTTGYEREHAQRMLGKLDRGEKVIDRYAYPVQAWRFGREFTLLALGGELVVDYALRFKQKYGWQTTWIAGYSNDVFGYIPSKRVWREGGYEGGGAFLFSSFPGPLDEETEEVIAASVDGIMTKVQR